MDVVLLSRNYIKKSGGMGEEKWLENKRVASRKPPEKMFQEVVNSQPDEVLMRDGN